MTHEHDPYLATMLCLYALFEFLGRRAFLVRWGAAVQAAVLFSLMLIATSGFLSVKLAGLYLLFAVLYALSGFIGGRLAQRKPSQTLELFIARQILIAALLVLIGRFALPIVPNPWYVEFEESVLQTVPFLSTIGRENWSMVLLIVAAYSFVVDGGTIVVRGVLAKFPALYAGVTTKLNRQSGSENEENVGEWIGILERIVALTLVLTGSFTALAFVLTAKSIARFKELEDKQFSEYYILGTSASLIVALFAGMAIRILFGL
jgi:hypothetical protein